MKITRNAPVRQAIGALPTYHENKGALVSALVSALTEHDIRADIPALNGDNGYTTCALRPIYPFGVVCDCCGEQISRKEFDNCLAIAWYTMQSGRVELTSYIS